jgi:predicted Zn finger-like uncharacterized protein
MDVTCERCSTAYEFDDALVSERGTTVKCTNCGHQFKVKRQQPGGAPERWLVRTIDGRELDFKALRELQTAIAQTQISREDVLVRGGSRPRRLGSIAELEPFFVGAGPYPSHGTTMGLGDPQRRQRTPTPLGLGAVGLPGPQRTEGSVAIPLPTAAPAVDAFDDETSVMDPLFPESPETRTTTRKQPPPRRPPPPAPSAPSEKGAYPGVIVSPRGAPQIPGGEPPRRNPEYQRTLPVPLDDALPPPARIPQVHIVSADAVDAATQARAQSAQGQSSPAFEDLSGLPPLPEPAPSAPQATSSQRGANNPSMTPMPSAGRMSYPPEETYGEPRFSSLPSAPRRTGAARWIVGFVFAGMLALAFATVGRKLLPGASTAGPAVDARIVTLLQEGEKSLLEGDLEGAQEQFAKASVLSDRDARVATDLAHLASVRGDIAWLRVRLLPDADPDLATAKRELDQAAERAQKAAAAATELAPNDAAVVRARIDALRLNGDVVGARKLVASLSAASAQPDNALALAELDLAEAKPDWPTVLGRLRAALSGDQNLGRARTMLVYALVRSGDVTGAKAELERIVALPRPHALVRPMRAFVNRESGGVVPEPSGSAAAGKPPSGKGATPGGAAKDRPDPPSGGRPWPTNDEPPPPTPPAGAHIDTSDLPGVKPPPSTAATPGTPTPPTPTPPPTPAGVDTSDLPGFK